MNRQSVADRTLKRWHLESEQQARRAPRWSQRRGAPRPPLDKETGFQAVRRNSEDAARYRLGRALPPPQTRAFASDNDVEAAFEATCSLVFREMRPLGASCTSHSQCADGSGCSQQPDGGAGVCAKPMNPYRGKEDFACGSTCFRDATHGGLECVALDPSMPNPKATCWAEDGIYCDPQSQVCTPSPVLGQPCTTGLPCRGDAYCPSGVCIAKGTSGPCGMFGDACASAAYCDGVTLQCVPDKRRGESCFGSPECPEKTDYCDMTCRAKTVANEDTCMGHF